MSRNNQSSAYRADLAYIHDSGFGHIAEAASKTLLDSLHAARVRAGRVVDLGCGSGIMAARLARAGYDVLGFDISPDMVELSRRRVPAGTFQCASVLDVEIPDCVAVSAVGEIFNYLFDRRNSPARLRSLFRRVYRALPTGGLFFFDAAMPGRAAYGTQRTYAEGDDWACLYEADEDRTRKRLVRRITTFRKAGRAYRRDREEHRLRLFERDELVEPLAKLGFRVRTVRRYGELKLPPGYLGFVARKT